MAKEKETVVEKEEEVVTEDENQPNTEPEPKGNGEGDKQKTENEVKFDELPDEVKRFIDQERTKASQTAREKARREALNDPDVKEKMREQFEEEAQLTAEDKLKRKQAEIAKRENRLDARDTLREAGISREEIDGILDLVVSDDHDDTMARADRFVNLFTNSLESAVDAKTRELIKNTPKPKTSSTTTKPFKEMSFDERAKLKQSDPARYDAEMKKSRTKI